MVLKVSHSSIQYSEILKVFNGAVKRVPGGVVIIGGLASEDVLVVWYHRYTV